jgi:autotransporter-associated beta strand protein
LFTGLNAPRSFTVQGNTTIGDWTLFTSGTSAPLDLNFNGTINVNSDYLRLGGSTSGTVTTNLRLNSVTVQGITTIASGVNLDLYSTTSTLGAVVNNGFFSIARAPTGSSGITVSVASLSGSGITANEALTVNKTNAATLVINGSSTADYTGSLRNGGTGQSLSLTKSGAGTQKLSGTNTYTGKTEVDAGTLIVNGNNASASGAVTVDFGAALGGLGRIGGNTTIDGDLNPGDNSKGTLGFEQGLILNGTSKTVFEITSLTSFDVLAGDGNHTIKFNDGADILFDFTGYEAHANDSFLVLNDWSARTGSGVLNIAVTNLTSGYLLDTSNLLTTGTIVVVRNPMNLVILSGANRPLSFCGRKLYSAGGKI